MRTILVLAASICAGCHGAAARRLVAEAPGVPHFMEVSPGVYRGGQPTSEGWIFLRSKGVKTVVKLDLPAEGTDEGAQEAGMTVVDASGPPSELSNVFGAPTNENLAKAVRSLRDKSLRPVFVHCAHGDDRTGLVVGMYRVLEEGWSKPRAYDEMRANGFHPVLRGLHAAWERFDPHAPPIATERDSGIIR